MSNPYQSVLSKGRAETGETVDDLMLRDDEPGAIPKTERGRHRLSGTLPRGFLNR